MDDQLQEQLRGIPYAALASELARRNAARRKSHQIGGRPAKLTPCINCEQQFGAREMRLHKPLCMKNARATQHMRVEPNLVRVDLPIKLAAASLGQTRFRSLNLAKR